MFASDVPRGTWVDLPGRGRTWVLDTGPVSDDAPAIVLLHGLGATAALNWAGAFAPLSRSARVVALDHRGHGRGIRTRHFRLADCADDVAALVEVLGIDRPVLAGYSMGGPVACLTWKRHPDLVRGLVLCATARNFSGRPIEKLAFGAMAAVGIAPVAVPPPFAGMTRAAIGLIPGLGSGTPVVKWAAQELAGHDPVNLLQAVGELGRFHAGPWLGGVDVPAAVVATTNDHLVPLARQLKLARAIPSSEVLYTSAGHLCPAGPEKTGFITALEEACRRVAGSGDDEAYRAPLVG